MFFWVNKLDKLYFSFRVRKKGFFEIILKLEINRPDIEEN